MHEVTKAFRATKEVRDREKREIESWYAGCSINSFSTHLLHMVMLIKVSESNKACPFQRTEGNHFCSLSLQLNKFEVEFKIKTNNKKGKYNNATSPLTERTTHVELYGDSTMANAG